MKGHSIKMNELKLTQTLLFQFFHFMCVAANASELICMAHLVNIKRFFLLFEFFTLNTKFYMHIKFYI